MPQMWQYVLDEIFQAIKMEPEPEMLANVLESFVKVSPIDGNNIESLLEMLSVLIVQRLQAIY